MPLIRPLSNKPLVEAIFELRWQIHNEEGDPHYTLFVGGLYDRVRSSYPFHEPLPTAMIPPPAVENIIQHRFRVEKDKWPLVQIGPGIVTVNDTEGYIWQDFGQRAKLLVNAIFDAYPEPEQLKIASLALRYLDAFELDQSEYVLTFLSNKLKSTVAFPPQLFQGTSVSEHPRVLNVMASFPTEKPKGNIMIRFRSGRHNDKPAVIMEIAVRSDMRRLPKMPEGFEGWVEAAHQLADDWFFKFIEGELERRFTGE